MLCWAYIAVAALAGSTLGVIAGMILVYISMLFGPPPQDDG